MREHKNKKTFYAKRGGYNGIPPRKVQVKAIFEWSGNTEKNGWQRIILIKHPSKKNKYQLLDAKTGTRLLTQLPHLSVREFIDLARSFAILTPMKREQEKLPRVSKLKEMTPEEAEVITW